jgi:hypothetical protein
VMESPDKATRTLSWSGGLVAGADSTNLSWAVGRSTFTNPTATGNLAAQSYKQPEITHERKSTVL